MAPNMVDSECVWSTDQHSGLKVAISQQQQQLTIVTKNLRCCEPIAWLLLSTPTCLYPGPITSCQCIAVGGQTLAQYQ